MTDFWLIIIGLLCLVLLVLFVKSLFYRVGRLVWCLLLMGYLTYLWWAGELAGGWVIAAGIISLLFVFSPATIIAFFGAAYATRAILKKQ